ncbi:MAG: hypothetical protein Q9216_007144 [Gyalolechia sp. 2 TL-2023]
MPSSEALTDEYLARLLAKDAEDRKSKYSNYGLQSFLPKSAGAAREEERIQTIMFPKGEGWKRKRTMGSERSRPASLTSIEVTEETTDDTGATRRKTAARTPRPSVPGIAVVIITTDAIIEPHLQTTQTQIEDTDNVIGTTHGYAHAHLERTAIPTAAAAAAAVTSHRLPHRLISQAPPQPEPANLPHHQAPTSPLQTPTP